MTRQEQMYSHKALRESLVQVGACASRHDTESNVRFKQILIGTCITALNLAGACSTTIIAIRYEGFESFLYSASDTIALLCNAFVMLTGLLCRQQLEETFSKIEQNYREFKSNEVIKYSEHASRQSQRVINIVVWRVIPGFALYCFTEITSTIAYTYYRDGSISPESLNKPYGLLVPWDIDTTYCGCFAYYLSCISIFCSYYYVTGVCCTLYLAICLDFFAFRKQFESIASELKIETEQVNPLVINKTLHSLIEHHIFIKNIFEESQTFFRRILFLVILHNLSLMTAKVFILLDNPSGTDVTVLIDISLAMATLYIHCQLGDETTENCLTLSGIMYEAEWYNHPSALHRYYILMIANMQRPLAFDGFYVVLLNLETYKQLMNTFVSYFMILRTLAV